MRIGLGVEVDFSLFVTMRKDLTWDYKKLNAGAILKGLGFVDGHCCSCRCMSNILGPHRDERLHEISVEPSDFLPMFFPYSRLPLPLIEAVDPGSLDSRDMDKHIFSAALRLNKSVSFLRIEPFYSAQCHS